MLFVAIYSPDRVRLQAMQRWVEACTLPTVVAEVDCYDKELP
jgi:hypothetical protein